jgi:hypothetical protein
VDHLDSKNLVPFKKRRNGYHLPKLTKEAEEQVIDEVDPELRPDEQGFVRHFLAYADVLLKKAEVPETLLTSEEPDPSGQEPSIKKNNITELPQQDDQAA